VHRMDPSVAGDQATLALPVGNGIQWACIDGGAGPGKSVLIMGPGQQGLGCVVGARGFGAEQIIVSGMTRDAKRLDVAARLGADAVVDVESDDLVDMVMQLTGGRGVDVVVDTTSDTTGENARIALAVAARKQATLVLQGSGPVDGFPLGEVKKKYATVKAIRGHSYSAVEQAITWITSGRFPFAEMCTSSYGLEGVDAAIKATAGVGVPDAIHVTVEPWLVVS
jgi:threonine dehydrogenase-like Zn-dependent dehydrogenase